METMHNFFNKSLFLKFEKKQEVTYINIGYINYVLEKDSQTIHLNHLDGGFDYKQTYENIKQQIKNKLKFFPNKNFIEIPIYTSGKQFLNNKPYYLYIDKNIIYQCNIDKTLFYYKPDGARAYFCTLKYYNFFNKLGSITFYQSDSFIENTFFNVS